MADIFIDGFDKYGPAGCLGTSSQTLVQMLTQGEWNSTVFESGASIAIVAPLSAVGQAIQFIGGSSGSVGSSLSKTLPNNYSRLIGGFRFQASLYVSTGGVTFSDAGTNQCSIAVNSTGTISFYKGATNGGTVLATSSTSITANATHYLEWDITFGSSSSYQVWLDGTSIISGTGQTETSGHSYANQIGIGMLPGASYNAAILTVDDLYLFDSTTSVNNAVLNTNPVVETQFGNGDSSVQFSFGGAIIGQNYYTTSSTNAPGANTLFLRPFTPSANCTLNSVGCLPQATSSSAHFEAVVFSDSGGSPHTLLSSGSAVTGCTAGVPLTGTLSSAQSLTGGTQYWIGFITDTSVALQEADTTTAGQVASNTYTSGAPSTAPTMTTGQHSWLLWGNITGLTTNYTEVKSNPPIDDLSYVTSSTAGNTDLYNFPNLSTSPQTIYTVAVKARVVLAVAGARTISLEMSSSGSTSNGNDAGQTPLSTFSYLGSFFDTDPHTSAAWTAAGINAATSGLTIAS